MRLLHYIILKRRRVSRSIDNLSWWFGGIFVISRCKPFGIYNLVHGSWMKSVSFLLCKWKHENSQNGDFIHIMILNFNLTVKNAIAEISCATSDLPRRRRPVMMRVPDMTAGDEYPVAWQRNHSNKSLTFEQSFKLLLSLCNINISNTMG
jgi:hypothetical protein